MADPGFFLTMKKFIILLTIALLLCNILYSKTIDLTIVNPRKENDLFKMEIELRRTDSWDNLGLGNCDFAFSKNPESFNENPYVENLNPSIDNNINYDLTFITQQNTFLLQIMYDNNGGSDWILSLNENVCLCTINFLINNPNTFSCIEWISSTVIWTTQLFDFVTPAFYGSGNISLLSADPSGNEQIVDMVQNSPNPFGSSSSNTNLSITVPSQGHMELNVFNIKGQIVNNLYNDVVQKNQDIQLSWDGKDSRGNDLSSGIYLYQLLIENKLFETKKVVIIR